MLLECKQDAGNAFHPLGGQAIQITLMSTVTVRSSAVYRAVRDKKPCRLPVCPTDSRGPGALSMVPSP